MCSCGEHISFNFLIQFPWIHVHGWWSQDQIYMGSWNSESQSIKTARTARNSENTSTQHWKMERERTGFSSEILMKKGEYFDDDDDDDDVLWSLIIQSIYQNHNFLSKSLHRSINSHVKTPHTISLFLYIRVWCLFLFLCLSYMKSWKPQKKMTTLCHKSKRKNYNSLSRKFLSLYIYICIYSIYICIHVCMCFSWAIIWSFFSRWISPFLALLSSFTFLHHFLSLKVCVSLSRKRARYLAVEDDVWLKEYNL